MFSLRASVLPHSFFIFFIFLIVAHAQEPSASKPVIPILESALDMTIQRVPDAEGTFSIVTTGDDSRVLTAPIHGGLNPEQTPILSFEYFCPQGVDALEIFLGPPIIAEHLAWDKPLPRAEAWMPFAVDIQENLPRTGKSFDHFRLDFGRQAGTRLQIRHIQLRARTPAERDQISQKRAQWDTKEKAGKLYRNYLAASFSGKIDSVEITPTQVVIKGTRPANDTHLALAEYSLWETPWTTAPTAPRSLTPLPVEPRSTQFSVTLPRVETSTQPDRLFSRWALVQQDASGTNTLASHAVFAGKIAAQFMLPEPRAKGIKGMGGVVWEGEKQTAELVELGVHQATVNVPLLALLANQTQSDGTIEHRFEGKSWWINRHAIEQHDKIVKFCTDHNIIVSAILLVENPATAPGSPKPILVHPEAESPGIFSMPNLSSPEGVLAYRAVLDFLAVRYARPDKKYGWISHWILHNEIDYAYTWTNMGKQPLACYMDAYTRSMRIAWLTARLYNPHAKVFISLTHNWTELSGPENQIYRTRDILEMLAQQSAVEGDFEWGIAYHPYPQNLFQPAAWNDTAVSWDFDTRLITPKNIEVLDAWLHQPRYLYQGKKLRSVFLSEQGFHTSDDSEHAQRRQAAAFVYVWHKIRRLETIESFHNHRWIDNPHEGGLHLGLRTLPRPPQFPFGEKKQAWDVYRALDTPAEAQATEFAKAIIGITDFKQIPYERPIGSHASARP